MQRNKKKYTFQISKNDLIALLSKDDFYILNKINESEFGFMMYLEKRKYTEKDEEQIIEILLVILRRVCSVPLRCAPKLDRFLRMLKDCQNFLFDDVVRVIHSCVTQGRDVNLVELMSNYMKILKVVLKKDFFPFEKILNDIFPALENYMNRLREKRLSNMEMAEKCFRELQRTVEQHEDPVYLDEDDELEEMNIKNFRMLSIVPRANDIVNYEIASIPQNIIDRPYKSVDHYLSVHYRLTREDMLRAFRACIKEYISSSRHHVSHATKVNCYENVIIGYPPEYSIKGISYKLKLTASKEIDWSKKGNLVSGSLVFLTPDEFHTVVFATVQGNPKVDNNRSKECRITILLEDDSYSDELLKNERYKLIEPTAFFECYKHVLAGIKHFSESNFPLSDAIAYLDHSDSEPTYLNEIKQFCLHEKCENIDAPKNDCSCKIFNPLKDEDWPTASDLKLNDQQYDAFKIALTKKVAVIQGPPGTGKTYTSVKIVKALLNNILDEHKPIVICCLTNHALDQFLERVLEFTKKVIRIGSQSKAEVLEPYKLENMMYAIQEHFLSPADKPVKNKSLDLVRKIAPSVLVNKIAPMMDYDIVVLKQLAQSINSDFELYALCEEKYLETSALNQIVDSEYKNQLSIKAGIIFKTLSDGILEWLVCSRSSDLYDKCKKKFYELKRKGPVNSTYVGNIWSIPEGKRYELFYSWRKKCLDILKKRLEESIKQYKKKMRDERVNKVDPTKLELLKNADIIGVTTTGACKYKNLIQLTKPYILVIEEAAQVLESHVIASLCPSTQHLILIGDHEQLRPLPADNELSEKYNLKISMFERLFCNNAPSSTLIQQHRMKPCIAELLVPKPYENYVSGENVYKYEEIKGFASSVFFLNHSNFEDDNSSGTSCTNNFEARLIVALAKYIVCNLYPPKDITILTTYAAQLNFICKYLQDEKLEIRATTVDNFQGEENEIILLSFVRSNNNVIGFLKESNRVCVALSRAKKGMFCLGNFTFYAQKNDMWRDIYSKLEDKNMIGETLPLVCFNHETVHPVKDTKDILGFISGGCSEKCNVILPCKHICTRNCHFEDLEHKYFLCKQPCERMMDETRKCPRFCFQKCKTGKKKLVQLPCGHMSSKIDLPCAEEVPKRLPCGHRVTIPCYVDVRNYHCEGMEKITLDCGHEKSIYCYQKGQDRKPICNDFQPLIGPCGHTIKAPCGMNFDENELLSFCDKNCDVLLDCGHVCMQRCRYCFDYGIHGFCEEKCELVLTCGHKCSGYCGSPCRPCTKRCFLSCGHSHCINECLRPCVKCDKPCERKCYHKKCSKLCSENCDVEPCTEPCLENLPCGHKCMGLCGDPCPNLCYVCDLDSLEDYKNKLYVELECEDVIELETLDEHIYTCLLGLEWPNCPKCSSPITRSVRYKKELKQAKQTCIDNADTTEDKAMLFYLVECMYGISFVVPSQFQYIHQEIVHIVRRENPLSDALMVLKNCVMMLKKLVNVTPKLEECNPSLQRKFDTLLLWISRHLTEASFQQLKELEKAVIQLNEDIAQTDLVNFWNNLRSSN